MFNHFKTLAFSSFLLAGFAPIHAEEYLGLNFGTSSKSLIGLSYASGQNAFNVGLMGIGIKRDNDFALQPGLTYNRQFTEDGWYSSWGYSLLYRSNNRTQVTSSSFGLDDFERQNGSGWQSGEFLMGIGQNFQWEKWAFNFDVGLALSAAYEFAKPLGIRAGIGGSYRIPITPSH